MQKQSTSLNLNYVSTIVNIFQDVLTWTQVGPKLGAELAFDFFDAIRSGVTPLLPLFKRSDNNKRRYYIV